MLGIISKPTLDIEHLRVSNRVLRDLRQPFLLPAQIEPTHLYDAVEAGSGLLGLIPWTGLAGDYMAKIRLSALVHTARYAGLVHDQTHDMHFETGLFLHLPTDTIKLALARLDPTAGKQPVAASRLVFTMADE